MYELLCGFEQLPFPKGSIPDRYEERILPTPVSLCQRRPDAPKELETIVHKAFEPDPSDRYQSWREFRNALSVLSSRM